MNEDRVIIEKLNKIIKILERDESYQCQHDWEEHLNTTAPNIVCRKCGLRKF
jgi:hypothetical protein